MIALTMWCTCPMILGHGQFVMPDVPAAAMGLCATYLFWRWLKKPHWARCAATGIVLGLALLSKTTLLVFFLVWPMLIAVRVCVSGKFVNDLPRNTLIGMTMLMLCLSIYVVNLGYGMTDTFERLGEGIQDRDGPFGVKWLLRFLFFSLAG